MARRKRAAARRPEADAGRQHAEAVLQECAELAERLAEPGRYADAAKLSGDVRRAEAIVTAADAAAKARLQGPLARDRAELAAARDRETAARAAGRDYKPDAELAAEREWIAARNAELKAPTPAARDAARERADVAADAAVEATWALRPIAYLCHALSLPRRAREAGAVFVADPREPTPDGERLRVPAGGVRTRPIGDADMAGYLTIALGALRRAEALPARDGAASLAAALVADVPVRTPPDRADVRRPHTLGAIAMHEPAPLAGDDWAIPLASWPLSVAGAAAQPWLLPPGVDHAAGPVAIADAAGLRSRAQGAVSAPLEARCFVELIAGIGRELLAGGVLAELEFELRELVSALWPRGPGGRVWDRRRDLPALAAALRRVHAAEIPYVGADGRPAAWRPIAVRTVLTPAARLGDRIVADVRLPADAGGGQYGPRVHMPTLRALGASSGPAWRAYLGLCWHWYAERSAYGWRASPEDLTAAERARWPTFGPRELAALVAPADAYAPGPRSRLARERARDVIARLATPGDVLPGGLHGVRARVATADAEGLLVAEDAGGGHVRLTPANKARALPRLLPPSGGRVTWS